jgi:hypothetical protein
MRAIDLLL